MKREFLVTNPSDNNLCHLGRTCINIPSHCKDMVLYLANDIASKTIADLRGRYPYLRIQERKPEQVSRPKKHEQTKPVEQPKVTEQPKAADTVSANAPSNTQAKPADAAKK